VLGARSRLRALITTDLSPGAPPQILKQKKMYEQQREQLYQQQFNVEQASFATDTAKANIDTVKAMKAAAKDFKQTFGKNRELQIDAIEELQDDMEDMYEMTNEVNEALGRNYNVPDDIDEDDLMDELDALEDELGEEELEGQTADAEGAIPAYMMEPELPSAPQALPLEGAPELQPNAPELENYGLQP